MTQQNPLNIDFSKWIVILALLGGVGGGITGFIGQLEPLHLILLMVAGALLGGVSSFILRILGQLVSRHEVRIVDLLDSTIQDFFTLLKPHARHYKRYLIRRYGTYSMVVNLENAPALYLKDVFVELAMNQDQPGMNPVAVSKTPGTKADTIWGYLKQARRLAIVGSPGSGKTTLLEHITIILAGKTRDRKALQAPKQIPILIKLRDHSKRFETLDTRPYTDRYRIG